MDWEAGKIPGLFDSVERPKILISRTDRIGDVVLSLPVARALKSVNPQALVHFLVREQTAPVIENQSGIDGTVIYQDGERGAELLGSHLAETRYDAVICLYPRPALAWAFFRAKIPVRIGTARRWYSFLFTHRVNVSRRSSGRHEKDLNLDLLRPLGIDPDYALVPELNLQPAGNAVTELLPEIEGNGRPVAVIHPGDGGSAANWPLARYAALAGRLSEANIDVIITGLASEKDRHYAAFGGFLGKERILTGHTSLRELLAVLARADIFIGGSTGPLHLAAALGTPVVGLYGPIRTTTPDRWGPCGRGHIVLTPDVPVCRCAVGRCKFGNCMERITLETVYSACVQILDRAGRDSFVCPPNKRHPASDLTPRGGLCQ